MPGLQLSAIIDRRRRMVGNSRARVRAATVKRLFRPNLAPIEYAYFAAIKRKIELMQGQFHQLYQALAAADTARRDAPIDDINRILSQLRATSTEVWKEGDLDPLVGLYANRLRSTAYARFQDFLLTVTGSKYFLDPSITQDTVRAHIAQNVSLIRTLPEKLFQKVEGIVFSDFRRGERHEETARKIEDEFGSITNNARLIARDQTSKLNGELNQIHQEQVGVEKYTWRTVKDDRVRSLHAEREGVVFSWDDPPDEEPGDGHPGEPINCRCYAEPVLEASERPV